jgi:microcystin-dependent protein
MANVTITPNMSLPVPNVGVDPGPDYANNVNSSLTILDQHNHSAGSGVLIDPTGLNINADLPMNGNNLTLIRSARFSPQVSPIGGVSDLGCLYVSSVDLWFNDVNGNQIQITSGGAVLATSSGITNGTNTASFISNILVVNSAPNTPANIQAGSILLGNNVLNSKFLTLAPPNAMAANFQITLPSLPASQSFLEIDTSGNITTTPISDAVNPSGAVIMFGGTSAPTGWLICDGTSYLRTDYTDLFTAIGTAFGAADGTHFNVPDLRGQFVRGVDNGAGRDPDTLSRTAMNTGGNTGDNVGSVEAQATAQNGLSLSDPGHRHSFYLTGASSGNANNRKYLSVEISNAVDFLTDSNTAIGGSTVSESISVETTGISISSSDAETRPINAYLNFIIKT